MPSHRDPYDDGPPVVAWSGNAAPRPEVLNVLAARDLDEARATLRRWTTTGCAIVVVLPEDEDRAAADEALAGVAVMFAPALDDAVGLVQRTVAETSPDVQDGGAREPDRDDVQRELLDDHYGLGPTSKDAWIQSLKDHGSDI